jgi:hypothetical protein
LQGVNLARQLKKFFNNEVVKMIKVIFYIIDNEFFDEYEYIGYFDNYKEVKQFINENKAVSNIVNVLAITKVLLESVPSTHF